VTVSPAIEIRAMPARVAVSVLLGVTVVLATAVHAALALMSPSPWIVPDELIYSELAKSLGDGRLPAVRDDVSFAYGVGYPALLAPIWAVFDDVTTAYAFAKVLNALLLGLTAVPAYFLARRFVDEVRSLYVAALCVAVPSMSYAGTLMTEVALYPAFVLALLAMTAALERPALATQASALGAIALVSAIKMLAAVLLLAYVAAIALYHWLDTRESSSWRGRLRAFMPTWVGLAGVLVAGTTVAVASGRSVSEPLGAYAVVLDNIDVVALPWWALLHVAELDLQVAVIPFAATLIVAWRGLRRGADRGERLFVALAVPVCAALVVVVAGFSSTPFPGGLDYPENVGRLNGRNTFVLAPLFFLGLMLALGLRVPSRRGLAVTGVVAGVLPALIPLERFVEHAVAQTPSLVPWIRLESKASLAWPLGCLILTGAFAALYVARARAAVTVVSVAVVLLATTLFTHGGMVSASKWTGDQAWGTSPDWTERAAGDATVSVLWAERGNGRFVEQASRHFALWLGEFFNRNVGDIYELGTPMPYGLPSTRVRLDDGRVVLEDGRFAQLGALVLVPCHVRVEGMAIARDPRTGMAVVRVTRPVRAAVVEPGSCPAGRVS
jgi:hypothetical protein